MSKELGQKVKMIRKARGLTQEDLAKLTELSCGYISCVERGIKNPRQKALEKLASALQVEVNEFYEQPSSPSDPLQKELLNNLQYMNESQKQLLVDISLLILKLNIR